MIDELNVFEQPASGVLADSIKQIIKSLAWNSTNSSPANSYALELVEIQEPDDDACYQYLFDNVQSAKLAKEAAITLTDSQRQWLQQIEFTRAKRFLSAPQMLLETAKLYITFTTAIDNYLQAETNESLNQAIHRLEIKMFARYRVLPLLHYLAEIAIKLHYLQPSRTGAFYTSLDLIRLYLEQAVCQLIAQIISINQGQLPVATPETRRLLALNDNGLPAHWWDKSGHLCLTEKLSMGELWLLSQSIPRKSKLLEDEDLKLVVIKLYLALHYHLCQHLAEQSVHFKNLSRDLERAEKYPYHQLLQSKAHYAGFLHNFWTLVITYRLYKPSVSYRKNCKYSEAGLKVNIKPALAAFWQIKANRQLARQLQPNAWRVGLTLVSKKLKSNYLKAASRLTESLLSDWEDSPHLAHIQQTLMNTWLKYDTDKSLNLAYLYIKQNPDKSLKTTKLDRYVLNTAQRRQLWQALWQNDLSDQQAQVIIDRICRSPQAGMDSKLKTAGGQLTKKRVIKINARQQKQIASEHVSTSQQLTDSLASARELAKTRTPNPKTTEEVADLNQLFEEAPAATSSKLKPAHHQLLKLLLKQPQLSQVEVSQLAKDHHLFPSRLINEINQAAYDKYGRTPIIKTESSYQVARVDLVLIKSLLAASHD